MGEVVQFPTRPGDILRRNKEKIIVSAAALACAMGFGYYDGRANGRQEEQNKYYLLVPKTCLSPTKYERGGGLDVRLRISSEGVTFSANGPPGPTQPLEIIPPDDAHEIIC